MPAPLKFGFLSQLVSIHFPGKTGPGPPAKPYSLQVTMTLIGKSVAFATNVSLLGILQGSGGSGKSKDTWSFNGGLTRAPVSHIFTAHNVTGQAILTLTHTDDNDAGLGFALSIEGPTQPINCWGSYVATEIGTGRVDSGVFDPSQGTTAEIVGQNNYNNGGNQPLGSCWYKGGFQQMVSEPNNPAHPGTAIGFYLSTPFVIPVDFDTPNKFAVGCNLPGWLPALPT